MQEAAHAQDCILQ